MIQKLQTFDEWTGIEKHSNTIALIYEAGTAHLFQLPERAEASDERTQVDAETFQNEARQGRIAH